MAANKKKRRVIIRYRHSSTLLKCVILTAIIFSTVALLVLKNAITQKKAEYDALRVEAAQQEHRRKELDSYVKEHGTVEGIKRYAEVVLGLVDPDTVFFEVTPKD